MSVENGISNSNRPTVLAADRNRAPGAVPLHVDRAAVVGNAAVLKGRQRIGAKDIRGPPIPEGVEKDGDGIVLDDVRLAVGDGVSLRDGGRKPRDLGIGRLEGDVQRRLGLGDADNRAERVTFLSL
jgi:hypothetical protein